MVLLCGLTGCHQPAGPRALPVGGTLKVTWVGAQRATPLPRQGLQRPHPSVAVRCPLPWQSGRPSLKLLAERVLGIRVQQAEHCSVSVSRVTGLGIGGCAGPRARGEGSAEDKHSGPWAASVLGGSWSVINDVVQQACGVSVKF